MTSPSIKIRRGELWWARLDPTEGSEIRKTRPVLVLSIDLVNENRRTVVVIPCSSSGRVLPPMTVGVMINGQLSAVVIDQIRAIGTHRLQGRIGLASKDEIEGVESALRTILALSR